MGDINTTSTSARTSPADFSLQPDLNDPHPPIEAELVGELDGLKVRAVSTPRVFSSLTNSSSMTSMSDVTRSNSITPFRSIGRISRSSTSTSSSAIDSNLESEEDDCVAEIEEKRSFLEQKIKVAEAVIFSSDRPGYVAFNEKQKIYTDNLRRALRAMHDLPSVIADEMGDDIRPAILATVDSILELADQIKKLADARIVSRLAGKPPSVTGSLGEAQEAIEHYLDYIRDLKIGSKQTDQHFLLAKKCVSTFKSNEALSNGERQLHEYYAKAVLCYETAYERMDGNDTSDALERAGDMFDSAAQALQNKRPDISALYKKAGSSFEQEGSLASFNTDDNKSDVQSESINHLKQAGNHFASAAEMMEEGRVDLVELFEAAGNCFSGAAQKLLGKENERSKQAQFLEQAGSYFLEATEVIDNSLELSLLNRSLGLSCQAAAAAINASQKEAESYYHNSYNNFMLALHSASQDKVSLFQGYQIIGKYFYDAGDASLKGEVEKAGLFNKAAQAQKKAMDSVPENRGLLEFASLYFSKAGEALNVSDPETSSLYNKAGDCNIKAADEKNPNIRNKFKRAASCYVKSIERKDRGFEEGDPIIQSFKTAADYNLAAAEKVEKEITQDDPNGPKILESLDDVSVSLLLAAEAMEYEEHDLAEAYNNYAASHHQLVMMRNPVLSKFFPKKFNVGFSDPQKLNPSVIKYWEDAALNNSIKISEIIERYKLERGIV